MKWIFLFALALASCLNNVEPGPSIANGIYEPDGTTTNSALVEQISISSNNYLIYTSYSDGCAQCQSTCNWRISDDKITFYSRTSRCRPQCDSAWEKWAPVQEEIEQIRNITPSSFEILIDATAADPAHWVLWRKL